MCRSQTTNPDARWIPAGAILPVLAILGPQVSATPYPFSDDMEDSASGNWGFDSPWGYDSTYTHSGSLSMSDTPDGYYENNVEISAELATDLDLTSASMPVLSFWHRYALEANADFGYVDVSR